MGSRTIKRLFLITCSLTIAASVASGISCRAQSADSTTAITGWEERLFFTSYQEEDLIQRITRIEKQIFGEALSGSVAARAAKLDGLLKQQPKLQKPVHKVVEAPPASMPASTYINDPASRARINVQAAREEEMSSLLAEGVALYREKDFAHALEKFSQVLRLDPANAQGHFNVGIALESLGQFMQAYGHYQMASKLDPKNSEYAESANAVVSKAKQQQQAVARKGQLKMLADSANAAWKSGDYNTALRQYLELDQAEPDKALIKYNIGSIYVMMQQRSAALDYYKQAATINPEPKFLRAYAELQSQVPAESAQQQPSSQPQQTSMRDFPAKISHSQQAVQPPQLAGQPKQSNFKAPNVSAAMTPSSAFAGILTPKDGPAKSAPGRAHFGLSPASVSQFGLKNTASGAIPVGNSQFAVLSSYGISAKHQRDHMVVTTVGPGSRAQSAGLLPGDDIRAVDGNEVSTPLEMERVLAQTQQGEKVKVVILRNGTMAVLNL